MSDDRISESQNPPRCPVCATGFTSTPGAKCPACGRDIVPPNTRTVPDVRLHSSDDWHSGLPRPASAVLGILAVVTIGFLAYMTPGLLIPIAILFIPAVIRTIRLAAMPASHQARSSLSFLFGAFLVSFFIATLAGIASAAAFGVVCFAIAVTGPGWDGVGPGLIAGSFVGLGVFLLIFYKLWPRESEYDKIRRSPDPEN